MEHLQFNKKNITLPRLYAKTKGNKTQIWNIFLELSDGHKVIPIVKKMINDLELPKSFYTEIVSIYGQKDGKMQEARFRIEKGKNIGRSNETNVVKQGILEMISKWTEQQDKKGYNIKEEGIEKLLVRPMLLHEFNKYKKYIDFKDAWIQEKMDGLRCMAFIKNDNVILMPRRGGEFYHLNHIRDSIKKIGLPKGIYLDGELFGRDTNFNQIISICKQVKSSVEAEAEASIKLYIYDMFNSAAINMTFTERYTWLYSWFQGNFEGSGLVLVKTDRVSSEKDVMEKYKEFIKYSEGAVIRDGASKYLLGKRSQYVLKLKPDEDAEFKIIGFKDGKGKDKGKIIFTLETAEGLRFDARPAATLEERAEMFKKGKEFIGKMGTVKFLGLTPDGIPRFPVFKAVREDY